MPPQKTPTTRRKPTKRKPKSGNGLPPSEYAREIAPKRDIVNPWGEDQISTTDAVLFRNRIRQYNPDDLVGRKGLAIYDQVRKDEQVKAALTTVNYAVLASGYTIEPPDLEAEEDPMAEEVTKFEEWNFAEMEGHFDSKLLNLMEARIFGFSWAEIVYFPIDYGDFNGNIGIRDIKFRRPNDVSFDVDEHGDMAEDGIIQANKRLPVEKFVLYSYAKTYDNPFGESELRSVYRSYWQKDIFQRFMAVALERYGEPIWVFTHQGRLTTGQRADLERFLKNLQSKSGIIIPSFITADPKTPPPRTAEAFVPAINFEDGQIRMGLLMPGLMGMSAEQTVGSLARSRTEFDVFLWIVQRNRNDIETVVNEQVIKRHVDLNYEVTGGKYPKFKFNAITEEFKHTIFGMWKEAVSSKALTKTREDENKARDLIGFPELPEEMAVAGEGQTKEEKERMREQLAQGGLPQNGNQRQAGDDDGNGNAPPGKFQSRQLSKYERRVDFALLKSIYDKDAARADSAIRELLKKARDRAERQAEDLLVEKLRPAGVEQFRVDTGKEVAKAVEDYLVSVWRKARDGAFKELPAQVKKRAESVKKFQINVGFEPTEALEFFRTRGLVVKGLMDNALTTQAKDILFQHLKGGRTTVETIGDLRELFEPYVGDPTKIAPSGPGRPAAEKILEAFRLENIVRTESATAVTQGRLAMGDAAGDYVIGYEYSAILDQRTCFKKGTLIKLADGRHAAIEQIKPGDRIRSGSGHARKVAACWRYPARKWRSIAFADGRKVICTETHKFWTREGWCEAVDLAPFEAHVGAESRQRVELAVLSAVWPEAPPVQQQSAQVLLEQMLSPVEVNPSSEDQTVPTMWQSPAQEERDEEALLQEHLLSGVAGRLDRQGMPPLQETVPNHEEKHEGRPHRQILLTEMLSSGEVGPGRQGVSRMQEILFNPEVECGQVQRLFIRMFPNSEEERNTEEGDPAQVPTLQGDVYEIYEAAPHQQGGIMVQRKVPTSVVRRAEDREALRALWDDHPLAPASQSEILLGGVLREITNQDAHGSNGREHITEVDCAVRGRISAGQVHHRFPDRRVVGSGDGRYVLAQSQAGSAEEERRGHKGGRIRPDEISLRQSDPRSRRFTAENADHAIEPTPATFVQVLSNDATEDLDWAYDLEIEHDHSYIAEGLMVHNTEVCQTADGLIIRKDDPRLRKLEIPNHYQCRSVLVFVTEIDAPVEWSSDSEINAAVELIQEGFD